MDSGQKRLYHQIHPAKVFTDVSMAVVSLYLFWLHNLIPALLLHFVPSIVVSPVLVRYANLDWLVRSRMGGYIAKYMTQRMEALRALGDVVMAVGAWLQSFWIIGAGLLIVAVGWLRGRIFPKSVSPSF